jgi:capsular exopolysaccharide synthesis family protein
MREHAKDHGRLVDLGSLLWRRKWIAAVTVAATVSTVFVGNFLVTPLYEASAMLYVKEQVPSFLGTGYPSNDPSDLTPAGEISTQMEILKSRSVLADVIGRLDLVNRFAAKTGGGENQRMQLAIDSLRKALSVGAITDTRLIKVSLRSPDPELAMRITNAISQAFIDRNVKSRRGEANAVLSFVSSQAHTVSQRLNAAEEDLLRYKQTEKIAVRDEETRLKLDRLSRLEVDFQQARLDRQILATRIAALQGAASAGAPGPRPATSLNPVLRMQIMDYRSQDTVLAAQEEALRSLISVHETEINRLPPREKRLIQLERARRINDELYAALVKSTNEAQIEAASQIGNINVVDPAVLPVVPVRPKKQENLFVGILLGLLLGVCFSFLFEYFDHSVTTEEEVKKLLGVPLLGFIPKFLKPGITSLLTRDAPHSPASEAFRMLRTNLLFVEMERGLKTIAVTSSIPGEGKTTIAANLAIALASQGERVLIVDADLRAPAVHRVFGLPQSPGFTSILAERADYRDLMREIPGAPRVRVITSGPLPPNPAEVVGSVRMKNLIGEFRESFDRVIFDAPPVLGATETVVLGSLMDGSLLVLGMGKMDRRAIRRTCEIFGTTRVTIVGGVLNRVGKTDRRYSHQYYRAPAESSRQS